MRLFRVMRLKSLCLRFYAISGTKLESVGDCFGCTLKRLRFSLGESVVCFICHAEEVWRFSWRS